jgi:hypothetical protein
VKLRALAMPGARTGGARAQTALDIRLPTITFKT